MKSLTKKVSPTRIEYRATQHSELVFVVQWASRLFGGTVLVVESVASCVPLIFFRESCHDQQYCFGVVWYHKELTIEEYLKVFLGGEAVLDRTPPLHPFDTTSMKVFAVYMRGKFGERELLMRIAVGRYE